MSLETNIEKLTAAVVRNNELLEKVIALGTVAPKTEAPKPIVVNTVVEANMNAPEIVTYEVPEPVVAEVEVVTADPEPEPATDGFPDHASGIRAIKEYAKAKYAEAGERLPEFQAAYASLREEFGIGKKTEELKDEQLMPFYLRLQEVLK